MYTMFGRADWFLICGLGSLGQHCVVALKEFEVGLIAIEQIQPPTWDITDLPDLLDSLIWGDCRQPKVLEQAKVGQCRAALILTANEQVNIETALAIRQLNPQIRLVIRSAKSTLNRLLSDQLGNFVAYDPTGLPAHAFALAALDTNIVGFFTLGQYRLQVIQCEVAPNSPWTKFSHLYQFDNAHRRLLAHVAEGEPLPSNLHQWQPADPLLPGDRIVYVEVVEDVDHHHHSLVNSRKKTFNWWPNWQQNFTQFWQLSLKSQVRRVAALYGITVIFLLLLGTVLFQKYYPDITFTAAFYDTAILLLGGYGDLFGNFQQSEPIPWWLRLFALGLTIAGTAFVGVLYAILTEALLSSKFQFIKQRPAIPGQDHIVIVGLGRVGQQVAAILQELRQPLVGITLGAEAESEFLPQLPILAGKMPAVLGKANCATAKSVVVVTADEIFNLEVALLTQTINPASRLVLRTAGQNLSELLPQLLPQAQILGAYTVAAEAFAGAAFGENIINLFRFQNQTILVTEYQIEAIDTLNGLLLADVTYGYQAMPVWHQVPNQPATFLPTNDICLGVGDRLVVMATIEGLRRIEQGRISIKPKSWRLRVERALTKHAAFQAVQAIAKATGESPDNVQGWMTTVPVTMPTLLYEHQGQQLVRALSDLQVSAILIPHRFQE